MAILHVCLFCTFLNHSSQTLDIRSPFTMHTRSNHKQRIHTRTHPLLRQTPLLCSWTSQKSLWASTPTLTHISYKHSIAVYRRWHLTPHHHSSPSPRPHSSPSPPPHDTRTSALRFFFQCFRSSLRAYSVCVKKCGCVGLLRTLSKKYFCRVCFGKFCDV